MTRKEALQQYLATLVADGAIPAAAFHKQSAAVAGAFIRDFVGLAAGAHGEVLLNKIRAYAAAARASAS